MYENIYYLVNRFLYIIRLNNESNSTKKYIIKYIDKKINNK